MVRQRRTAGSQSGAGGHGLRSRVLAGFTVVLASLGVALVPSIAQAVELDAITGVTIVEPTDQISVQENFRVEATWVAPNDAVAGDTFTLNFPTSPLVAGVTDVFDLTGPGGVVVGTCNVASASITCTLSDYVDTHDNVQGTVSFFAQAQETTDQTTLTFTTENGTPFTPAIPGGGIGPAAGAPLPTAAQKAGQVSTDGRADWAVFIPSSQLVQGAVITDTATAGMEVIPATLQFVYIPNADWNNGVPTSTVPLVAGTDYVLANAPGTSTFTLTMLTPIAADSIYRFSYFSDFPDTAQQGDVFTNTVSGVGFSTATATVISAGGGGTGEGSGEGSFSVTKAVTGEGAALVPAGESYTVSYSYTDADGTPVAGVFTLDAGVPQSLTGLPDGAVVTLAEVSPSAVDDVIWGEPVFSGTGVTPTASGATVTIAEDMTVAVTLTNPAALEPPGFGSVSIVKALSGEGASLAPADLEYTVNYAYTDAVGAEVTGSVALTAGIPQTLTDLPENVVVRFTEQTPPAVNGIIWGAPAFSGAGVSIAGDAAQVTIAENATVAMTLTNPTTVPPIVPPLAPPTGGLAHTGQPIGWGPVIAAVLLIAGTAMLTVTSRRMRRQV